MVAFSEENQAQCYFIQVAYCYQNRCDISLRSANIKFNYLFSIMGHLPILMNLNAPLVSLYLLLFY